MNMKKIVGLMLVGVMAGCAGHPAPATKPVETVSAPMVVNTPAPNPTFDVSRGVELHWLDGAPPA
jgi:hypothetical protein